MELEDDDDSMLTVGMALQLAVGDLGGASLLLPLVVHVSVYLR